MARPAPTRPDQRGGPGGNTGVEAGGDHGLDKLAGDLGAAAPPVLAPQLALLIAAAIVAALGSRDPGVADTAGLAAGSLFGPSRVKKPKRTSGAAAQLVAV